MCATPLLLLPPDLSRPLLPLGQMADIMMIRSTLHDCVWLFEFISYGAVFRLSRHTRFINPVLSFLTLSCLFLPCLVLSCFVQCCVALSCSVLGFASIHKLVSHSVFVLPCHIACLCHCDVCVTIYNARCVVLCVDLVWEPFLSLSVRATTDIDHTLDL